MQSSEDLGNTFSRAWQLLSSNWIIVVPAIIIGVLGGIVMQIVTLVFIGGGAALGSLGSIFLGAFLALAVACIVQVLTVGFTTGMGVQAWRTNSASIADGSAVFSNSGALATIVIWMVIGIVLALIPVIGWLADIILFFVLVYSIPHAVVSGDGAGASFSASLNMVSKNFIPTLLIILLIAVIGIVGGIIGAALSFIPYLGRIVSEVIQAVVVAYGTLVIVGEYLKLRSTIQTVGVGTPPTASPPPPTV